MGKFLTVVLCSVFALSSYAQLTDFTLSITKTDESCLGNGTLTFSVSNTTPLATFLYTIYQLPDTDVPVSVLSTNFLGSLNAGTYRVIATQMLNGLSNSKQQDIVINNTMVPLTYAVTAANQGCTAGGKIIVNTLTGTASAFEILSGPVVRSQQASNEFDSLPQGTYNIRVINQCGVAVVQAYTLILTALPPVIADTSYPNAALAGCSAVTVSNTISASAGSSISYPISVLYTLVPPNGDPPIVSTETISSGGASVNVVKTVPLYGSTPYTYSMVYTDACGTVVTKSGNVVNPLPTITHQLTPNTCGQQFLTLHINNFMPPYNLAFVSAPASFSPAAYNGGFPGPYSSDEIVFGSLTQTLPEGPYEVSVTDACGRTGSVSFNVINTLPPPTATGRNNGCFATVGRITATASPRFIVSAIISVAPPAYTATLPQNVTSSIAGENLILNNMPLGNYELILTDDCNNTYTVPVNVPAFVEQGFLASARLDCTTNNGSLRVRSGNARLTEIRITAAPAAFTQPLPYVANSGISAATGELYLEALPEGSYTFEGTDGCGIQKSVSIAVAGYHPDPSPFTYLQRCGSFDVSVHDTAAAADASYWLQQKDNTSGQWMHPQSGVTYTEGSVPDASNSLSLANNSTLYNTVEEGTYRLVKIFAGYAAATGDKMCQEILGEFTFIDGIRITNAYTLACLNTPNDVYLEVEGGLAPYSYRITQMNGSPFTVNNGASNIFSNLSPAVYKFEVEDACGNIDPAIINIGTLPSLVSASAPGNYIHCVGPADATLGVTFDLASKKTQILGPSQSLAQYTVTFYTTAADAQAGSNAIAESYQNTTSPQTIYARVVHNSIPICNAVTSFDLVVSPEPDLQMDVHAYLCEDGTVTLVADSGFADYQWTHTGWTGPVSGRSVTVNEPGDYTVSVSNAFGCSSQKTVLVELSHAPSDVIIETIDWTTAENQITVITNQPGTFEFSLDGNTYQTNNVFSHLETGVYTVYIKDVNGCGLIKREVVLMSYPKFFTPNGDGYNEKWTIEYSVLEPDMEIEIYDRMGKIIKTFNGGSSGWDGTYNGARLPSTDYWFVVRRHDGRILKGHFAMLR